ncbi:hypothetical protein ACT048_20500 [Ectopseudomonas khazarica]|uniref:hypothetical protein n=1 Tax=Ectopseudomonas khazarica TaxID=2502979 RepID=UPI004033ABA2
MKMIRSVLMLCCALFVSPVFAGLPPAPIDQSTVTQINAVLAPVEQQFLGEMQKARGDNRATADVMGRYMYWAFTEAGYSYDETLYQYLTDNTVDNFVKASFAKDMGFGLVLAQVASQVPGATEAYLKSGALTQRSVDIIVKSTKPNTDGKELELAPVSGWQYPADKSLRESRIRMSLSPFKGEGQWANYVIFRTYSPDDYYVLGERSQFDTQTLSILDKLTASGQSVTVEGDYRAYPGQGGSFKICLLDRSKPVRLTLPQPLSNYR